MTYSPSAIKASGYTTTGLGKTFHPGSPRDWDQPKSWTERYPYWDPDEQIASFHTRLPPGDTAYPAIEGASGDCVKKTGGGFISHDENNWTTTCALPEHNTTDYLTASRAVTQLAQVVADGAPFFFAVGFHSASRPLAPPYIRPLAPPYSLHTVLLKVELYNDTPAEGRPAELAAHAADRRQQRPLGRRRQLPVLQRGQHLQPANL